MLVITVIRWKVYIISEWSDLYLMYIIKSIVFTKKQSRKQPCGAIEFRELVKTSVIDGDNRHVIKKNCQKTCEYFLEILQSPTPHLPVSMKIIIFLINGSNLFHHASHFLSPRQFLQNQFNSRWSDFFQSQSRWQTKRGDDFCWRQTIEMVTVAYLPKAAPWGFTQIHCPSELRQTCAIVTRSFD